MSLYGTSLYGTTFFGGNQAGSPPGGITGLNAYQNVDGTAVLYWSVEPCASSLASWTWTVETDLDPSFTSSRLRTYTSVSNSNFLAGGVHKGLVVPTYARQQGTTTVMYWRVQGHDASADTDLASSSFVIPEAINDTVRQAMLNTLPDVIYKKDFASGQFQVQSLTFDGPLLSGNSFSMTVNGAPISVALSTTSDDMVSAIATAIAAQPGVLSAVVTNVNAPPDGNRVITITANAKDYSIELANIQATGTSVPSAAIALLNSTNVNRLFAIFGNEMDSINISAVLVNNDLFTATVRDQSLYKNWAYLLGLQQPSGMLTIDFREIVRQMIALAGDTPSQGALSNVLATLYCEAPTFTLVRDTLDMYVDDPTSSPAVDPFYVDDPSSSPPVDAATVWDNHNLAFGVIITINNPLGLSIPSTLTQQIVDTMAPIHVASYLVGA